MESARTYSFLLLKLLYYGFDYQSVRLLTSYFHNRRQFVKKFDDCNPDIRCTPKMVNSGVPQGSFLGPFLFLVFINDLPFLYTLLAKLFADDTTQYVIGDDIDALILDFNSRALAVFDWCNFNRLDMICSKTFAMFNTNKRVKIPISIVLCNHRIESVNNFKLQGVNIDN